MTLLRRTLRPDSRPPSLRFRGPNIHIPLRWLAAGWVCVLAWRALCWLAVHPRSTAVAGLTTWMVVTNTVWVLAVAGLLAGAGLAAWWVVSPASFTRHVTRQVQLRLRRWWMYQRNWQPAMLTAGLSLREHWGGDLPTLRGVADDGGRDLLRVRMLPGQTLEQWTAAAAALAQTFDARQVRVRRIPNRNQELWLVVTHRNGGTMRHVTERTVQPEPRELAAPRGAFPRTPRGGAL